MHVQYATSAPLALGGIGTIARHGVEGIARAGLLATAYTPNAGAMAVPWARLRTSWWVRLQGRWGSRERAFDHWLARRLSKSDILYLWNSGEFQTVERARALGMRVIIDRASTHPIEQWMILERAHRDAGLSFNLSRADFERRARQVAEADLVVVPSQQVIDSFHRQGHARDNLHLANFGVDLGHFSPREKSTGPFRFVFVGLVSLRKGVQHLLPAFQRLGLPDAELWLVGPVMPDAESTVAPYRGRSNIRFHGLQADPLPFYHAADAFVFPSLEEGSALVTYEAQACGLPVITTRESGAILTHGEAGLIIPAWDSAALAEAMLALYKDRDTTKVMGLRARQAIEAYPWERYGDAIAAACRRELRG